MPARTKSRAKFDFHGRQFVWWIDNRYLRISSLDKKFIIAYAMGTEPDDPPVVGVVGVEFPGLDKSDRRPVWLVAPPLPNSSVGAWVDTLLRWSFGKSRKLERKGPPRFIGDVRS